MTSTPKPSVSWRSPSMVTAIFDRWGTILAPAARNTRRYRRISCSGRAFHNRRIVARARHNHEAVLFALGLDFGNIEVKRLATSSELRQRVRLVRLSQVEGKQVRRASRVGQKRHTSILQAHTRPKSPFHRRPKQRPHRNRPHRQASRRSTWCHRLTAYTPRRHPP